MIMDQPSLDQHCLSLQQTKGKRFCKQALDKRFNDRAVAFMESLFSHYLQNQFLSKVLPSAYRECFSSIRLMDSTKFKLPEYLAEDFPGFDGDGTKSCTQIQFEYDILSGKIIDLSVVDSRVSDAAYAESLLANIQSKDLVIRDLGYSKIDSFKEIEARGAYYISRLNPNIKLYEQKGEALVRVSYKTILKRLKGSKKRYLDIPIFLGSQAHPVRLTANRLTPEDVKNRLTRKIYRRNDKPEVYDYLREMNLFVTNIPKSVLSPDQIYSLYKVRWQVELIFKVWKSVLKINKVRKMKADRFKCYLLGKLLWVVLNWEICSLFNVYVEKNQNKLLSLHKCFDIIKQQARRLEEVLLYRKTKLKEWLQTLYETIARFGIKEHRKGRMSLLKLLALH
jgi:hypothetical protein